MSIQTQIFKKKAKENAKENAKGWLSQTFDIGVPLVFGVNEFSQAREQGDGFLMASTRAVGDFALGEMLGFKGMLALEAAKLVPTAIAGSMQGLDSMSRSMNRAAVSSPFSTATFNDNQRAYTMRQAGMQLAQASKYNLQQTLMGNEAQYMKY